MNGSILLIACGLVLIALGVIELTRSGGLGPTLAGIIVAFLGTWLAGIGVLRAAF